MKNPGKPTIKGSKIVLRSLGAQDASVIYGSLQDPISQKLTGTHRTFSFEDVQAHCRMIEAAEDRWDYGISLDGRLIGEVVLNHVDAANESASFRIAIWEPQDRGRGYGTEATRLLVDFGFCSIGLNRIELEVYAFNPQARRAYEKVGFKAEGTKREALIWEGEKVDAHIMSILRSEYLSEQVAQSTRRPDGVL